VIHGIRTNIPYLSKLLISQAFISNSISTKFCDEYTPEIISEILKDRQMIHFHLPLIGYLLFSLGIETKRKSLWVILPVSGIQLDTGGNR